MNPRSRLCCALLFAALGPTVLLGLIADASASEANKSSTSKNDFVLVIHGGAGTLSRTEINAEREAEIRAALDAALDAGASILAAGGSSLDAVSAAIVLMEDSPHFNAGHGAVFTAEGRNELDAALMNGSDRRAGAVAGLREIRNPILLARAVMQRSPHVMLVGEGAQQFADSIGMARVDPKYFWTQHRWDQLQKAKAAEKAGAAIPATTYFGTVGAVALDQQGQLAAGTSTGGMTNKRWGRVGDAPIIGAGTWADEGCAVSATGWGEYFIRLAVAHDICARRSYAGAPLVDAADVVVMQKVPALGGDGGVIAVDAKGNVALPFNTPGMYRGWIRSNGERQTAIFRDNP
ncbi:MAG: isoaspartyl peptidase/L-asparaginase family protein [Pseudomarimonas sp.]